MPPTEESPSQARQDVAAALARAGREGKRVAVIFGASWCADSRALGEALAHRLVAPIVEPAFVVVWVDVGNRDRNLDLMAEYGMAVERGIPAVAVLDAEGRLLAAQREGELASARALAPIEIATQFHRWSRAPMSGGPPAA